VLTPGDYDLIDRAVIDEAGGWYSFYASPDNATQKYLYRVPLPGSGALERVTPQDQPDTHDYVFSPDAAWAFHTYSTLDTPPVVELVELPTRKTTGVSRPADCRRDPKGADRGGQAAPHRDEAIDGGDRQECRLRQGGEGLASRAPAKRLSYDRQ
jgi:hypothetical protein